MLIPLNDPSHSDRGAGTYGTVRWSTAGCCGVCADNAKGSSTAGNISNANNRFIML